MFEKHTSEQKQREDERALLIIVIVSGILLTISLVLAKYAGPIMEFLKTRAYQ